VDTYQVTVATPTVVRLETLASLYGCNITTDVRLFDAAGAPILADVTGLGISGCGSIVVFLDAGTYVVSVEEPGNDATIADYFLSVDYQDDRGVESEPTMTTGVNDTTMTADANLVNGNNVYVFGDHLAADDIDVYAFTVPPFARIRAEVIEGDFASETCGSNGIDSHLTLFDQNGVQLAIDDDNGRGFCSLIDGTGQAPLHAAARNNSTTAQTYFLRVQRPTLAVGQEQTFVYRLQVTLR
jgi:hypothetical protein